MKTTIEIYAGFTGVIPTGQFENEKPSFGLTERIEYSEDEAVPPDAFIKERQRVLTDYCFQQFKLREQITNSERIAKLHQNIRFYPVDDGRRFPSVTSIINWDDDFRMPPDLSAQYMAKGTIVDKQVEIFLTTGKWLDPSEIPEVYPETVIVNGGSLCLKTDDVDFRAFYKEYPFKVISLQNKRVNMVHEYGGRDDVKCIIESKNKGKWEKIEGILYDTPTILDVKTGTIVEEKYFKQQAAYMACDPEVKQIGLIPLTNKNQQGFSKPLVVSDEKEINKYMELFLRDRANFKKRYGI